MLCCACAIAQEKYRVVYDYSTDRISYFLLDKNNNVIDTLKHPKLKRNRDVELRLLNVNPFAVSVSTTVNEETIHGGGDQEGFGFGSLLGQIGMFGQDKLKMNVPSSSLQSDLLNKSGSTRGPKAAQKIDELADITTNVSAIKSTLVSNLANPNLDKQAILKNLEQVTQLYEDARLPDPNSNFYAYLVNMEKVVSLDKQDIVNDMEAIGHDVESSNQDVARSRGQLAEQEQVLRNLTSTVGNLESAAQQTINDINEIKAMYAALESSSFEQVYDYKLESDKMNIDLKFTPTVSGQQSRTLGVGSELKQRSLRLTSRGGIKINSGVALTMNNYGKSSQDFFISQEGLIEAQKNDYFTPNLSTMINFYPVLSESFNIGGSFGLSIPISDEVGGVNFLLGPSLFLGSKNRLSFSGGFAYGPVKRLSNGLKTGDVTELRSLESFTKSVYDLGYFFGISFSLFNIN